MSEQIGRRELLKIASVTIAGLGTGRLALGMPRELVQNVAKATDWKPLFFNTHQSDTIAALTNVIIPSTDTPGAREAKVYRYVDLFMTVKSPAEQKQFLSGLDTLDETATRTHQKQFADCNETQQAVIFGKLQDTPFFAQAKNLTSSIYYSTPEGYAELNKSGPPPTTLGCPQV